MCLREKENKVNIKPIQNRSERDKLFKEFLAKHEALIDVIDGFKGGETNHIKKKTLRGIPLMQWVNINHKVRFRRRNSIGDLLVFDTIIEAGGAFGIHSHDCNEICDVIEGDIIDLITDSRYNEGQTVVFNKGETHLPISTKHTVLKVYFD